MKTPPGQLRADLNPEVLMMICTAGHVDHGKTSLVRLLTGCETDRLKEEKERGLTIELGFAPCYLGGNLCVGIVDVPGHEKFIKNMVAGVSGIEMTVLVIAADDGVMPQTVEHFQIMDLLGVRNGMVALTKIDLVSKEDVQQRIAEIRAFLKATFMEDAPICPVSSETFDGYSEFYDTLVARIKGVARRRRHGVFRMPVERVFAQHGFGNIVSGIPVEGSVRLGEQVEIVLGGQTGRIRGIQRFGRDAEEGSYGQCLALNIPDFSKAPLERGNVLCPPGYLKASCFFNIRLTVVPGTEKPLSNAEQIKFHTGTIEEPGKIYLLQDKPIGAGQSGWATVALSRSVAAAAHDRFILRRPSPAVTVAGGEILFVSYSDQRPRKKEVSDKFEEYARFFGNADPLSGEGIEKRIEYFLLSECKVGASMTEIGKGTLLSNEVVAPALSRLVAGGKVMAPQDDYFVYAEAYRALLAAVEASIKKAFSERKELSLGISDLRAEFGCPGLLWSRVQSDLEAKKLVTARGNKLVMKAGLSQLPGEDQRLAGAILRIYKETAFHSPRPDELPPILRAPQANVDRLLQYLVNDGQLIRITKNVVLSYESYKKAQELVIETVKTKGLLNSADFKDMIDSSRKYAISILDYLDSRRVTVRVGNDRKLTPDYQKNLV